MNIRKPEHPPLHHLALNMLTGLFVYAYIKQQLQIPPFTTFIFSHVSLAIWNYDNFKATENGLDRAHTLIPSVFCLVFTLTVGPAFRDHYGLKGGLDDNKWLVRHRKTVLLLFWALSSYIYTGLLIRRRDHIEHERHIQISTSHHTLSGQTDENAKKSILMSLFSTLSTPLTFCSGGACNSIYMSTVTSLLSSFSLPMTLILPFLNIIAYCFQLIGLVSLYSVNKFRYVPFWVYLASMVAQLKLQPWMCGLGMLSAVVYNAKFNKFVYGRNRVKRVNPPLAKQPTGMVHHPEESVETMLLKNPNPV